MSFIKRAVVPLVAVAAGVSAQAIPIDLANNHVYLKTEISGKPFEFIFDTGAPASFIDLNVTRSLNIEGKSMGMARGAGAGGTALSSIPSTRVRLAGTDVTIDIPLAIDLAPLTPREAHHMDGIIGGDFLQRYVVTIDYASHEMRLSDPKTFHFAPDAKVLPFKLMSGHPHIEASFTLADGQTLTGTYVLDVGSAASLSLFGPYVARNDISTRVGKTVRRLAGGGVGGVVVADQARIPTFTIAGYPLGNVTTTLYGENAGAMSADGPVIGNIGGDILRHFTVTFDYATHEVAFTPNASYKDPFEFDMTGMALMFDPTLTTLSVDYILDGSPAAEAGLMKGDVIDTIDGTPMNFTNYATIRMARFKKAGQNIALGVRRNGEKKTITIRTRRIV
jgi:hypothetical protein